MADGDRTDNVSIANSDNSKIVDIITDGSLERFAGTSILTNAGGGKIVTVTTDDGKERLDVSAKIVGGSFSLGIFIPMLNFSTANTALNTSTDTSLLSITAAGKIDFIGIAGSNSNYEIILKVDGTEVFRLPATTIGSTLGLTGATGLQLPIWMETANKNFRYHPNEAVDFSTSFEVLAKATGTPTGTVNFLINHRETT